MIEKLQYNKNINIKRQPIIKCHLIWDLNLVSNFEILSIFLTLICNDILDSCLPFSIQEKKTNDTL